MPQALSGEILPEEEPGYYYGNVLPYRIKEDPRDPNKNATGSHMELAWPAILRDAVNSIGQAAVAPGNALLGAYTPDQIEQMGPSIAMTLAGGGAPGEAPAGALRMFAGMNAKVPEHGLDALEHAMALHQNMSELGHAPDLIREKTRDLTDWFQGDDGRWRFEIPDTNAKLKLPEEAMLSQSLAGNDDPILHLNKSTKLGDLLHHPELFEMYPDAQNITVHPMPLAQALDMQGAMNKEGTKLWLSPQTQSSAISTILHEVQHAIQQKEDFARGGAVKEFLPEHFDTAWDKVTSQDRDLRDKIRQYGANPYSIELALGAQPEHIARNGYWQEELQKVQHDPELLNRFKQINAVRGELETIRRKAVEKYKSLGGEIEARTVENRWNNSQKPGHEAYRPYPWQDPEAKAYPTPIFKFRGDK